MGDLSDLVLDSLSVLRRAHDDCKDEDRKARIVSTYFNVVDVVYADDITKCLAYKKLWYQVKP